MDTLTKVEELLKTQANPHELADAKAELASYYSYICGQLEEVSKAKPKIWMDMREKTKSDNQTNKMWDASELGQEEIVLRLRVKRMEKLFGAIGSILRVSEQEARNNY